MDYFDTSLVVALLTHEPHSARADRWFAARAPGAVAVSAWVATEFAAALAAKVRLGTLTQDRLAAAVTAFRELSSNRAVDLEIQRSTFWQRPILLRDPR